MFTHADIWSGIDRLAIASGYSPSGLAKQAGLDPTSFNKSKRISPDGKPRWPSTESISKVLNVTDYTMKQLFDLIEGDEPKALTSKKGKKVQTPAQITAQILLDTKSVLFNAKEPFTLKSGRKSPVYIDGRRLISFVQERNIIMDFAADMIRNEIGVNQFDIIAGGETAGIPYGAYISERLKKPMVYVRKEPKGYGRMAQIEGVLPECTKKNRAILVEDLQTDGGSKKTFINALRDADVEIKHAFVIFHYGILEASTQNMKDLGIKLHALTTWWDVLDIAKSQKYFDKKTLASVENFLNVPDAWEA